MATGSISSLGIGSNLELQSILDQLKDVESAPIRAQESEKVELQETINAYNSINATLFSMKSHALSLSLESDFLKNKVTVSDEEILTARVDDGISESATSIEVTQKASANTWTSPGVDSKSAVIYPEPATAITGGDVPVTAAPSVMTIQYGAEGAQESIDINLSLGMSLNLIAETINASETNKDDDGNQYVTASVETNSDNQYYIRLKATNGGNSADSQITVDGFDYVKSDTTIAIGKASDTENAAYISIAPGTTYAEIADIINNSSDNPDVIAAIIDDGSDETPYKLTITSKSTGEDNRISIQNLPMTEVTGKDGASLNAMFTVNGVSYQRQSNDDVDDILDGVTLSLKKTGEATISVQNDLDSTKQNIIDFVNGFNTLLSQINGTETDDDNENDSQTTASETDSPLEDSYEAKKIVSELHAMIGTSVDTNGEYSSLYDIGLTLNRNGTITIDETILDQAISSNPDDVKSLFLGDDDAGIKGLGATINDGLTSMLSLTGSVTTQIDSAELKLERLDKDIETATERLDKRYEIMTADFARLDTYISQVNNEASLLTSIFESFNNTNNNS